MAAIILCGISSFARNAENPNRVNRNGGQTVDLPGKPVWRFESFDHLIDMFVSDAWGNMEKVRFFRSQHNLRPEDSILLVVNNLSAMKNGVTAVLYIPPGVLVKPGKDISAYRLSFRLPAQEEQLNEFGLAFINAIGAQKRVELVDFNKLINLEDINTYYRFTSVKSVENEGKTINYYRPYLDITSVNYGQEVEFIFTCRMINENIVIQRQEGEPGGESFHRDIRRLAEAVSQGKITESKFAGKEVFQSYYNDKPVPYEINRYESKVKLAGTVESFITRENGYTAKIAYGDEEKTLAAMTDWLHYLSAALGKNYIAIKTYNEENRLSGVTFLPVNREYGGVNIPVKISLYHDKGNEWPGIPAFMLEIRKPETLFGPIGYHHFWTMLTERL